MAELNGTEWADGNATYPVGGDPCIAYSYTCSYCGRWITDHQNHYCYSYYPGYYVAEELEKIGKLLEEMLDLLKDSPR